MGMALKVDVENANRVARTARPVDLVHLSSMTMGDRALELEILNMFVGQAPAYFEMATSASDAKEVYRVAHTIKGAARGIGAFELADIAKEAEDIGKFDLVALEDAFTRVRDYVLELSH